MAKLTPVDYDPFAPKLTPVDFDPFTSDERSWGEAFTDTMTGIGAGALDMGAGLAREINTRTPWSGVTGGDTAFRGLEAGAGIAGGLMSLMPDAVQQSGIGQAIGGQIDKATAGLALMRGAMPENERNRSEFVDAAVDVSGEYADRARESQSDKAKRVRRELAESADEGFFASMSHVLGKAAEGDVAPLGQLSESLVPSLAAGGAVGRFAGTPGMLGTMSVLEGGGAGAGAREAVMAAPPDVLAADPIYQGLVAELGDPTRARMALADMAGNIGAMTGTVASAAMLGIGQKLGLNVAEDTLLGRAIASNAATPVRMATGAGKEFVSEGSQEAANTIASNLGTMAAGVEDDVFSGAGGAFAQGGLAGAPSGALAGIAKPPPAAEAGAKMVDDALREAGLPPADAAPADATPPAGPAPQAETGPQSAPVSDPDAELDALLAPLEPITPTEDATDGQQPRDGLGGRGPVVGVGTDREQPPGADPVPSPAPDAAPAATPRAIDPAERSRADFERRLAAAAEGLPAEQVERFRALYREPARDRVTGLYRGEEMRDTLEVAWEDSDTTPAVYVEMDMANLGGLNAVKGNSGADPYLKRAGEIARDELAKVGATVAMRKGGDEFGYVVQGADQATVDAAMTRAQQAFAAEMATEGLDTLPNPKPERRPGVGIVFGSAPLVRDAPIADTIARADTLVEARKKEGSDGNRAGEAAGDPRTAAAEATRDPAGQAGGPGQEVQGSRGEARGAAAAEAQGLTEQQTFDLLEKEIGWEQIGGKLIRDRDRPNDGMLAEVAGRTNWQPKIGLDGRPSQFWRMRPDTEGFGEKDARRALRKYREGKKLGKREQRFIDYAWKTARDYVEMEQAEIAEAREAEAVDAEISRQADIEALRADGAEFDPADEREALALADWYDRAYAAGATPEQVLDATFDASPADGVRNLSALIEELNRGTDERAEAVDRASGLETEGARVRQQGSLFGAPTQAERLDAARREKDAQRNGLNRDGRTDILAGDGELFAGPRPEQTDLEGNTDALRSRRQEVPFDQRNLARLRAVPSDRTRSLARRLGMPNVSAIGEVSRRDLPRDLAAGLVAFEAATQTQVVVTKGLPANGVALRDGVLYVDVSTDAPLLTVAAHEWVHQLREDNPTLFNLLRDEVRRQGRLGDWKAELQRRMTRDGEDASTLTDDLSSEELTADAMADAVTDPVFLREFAARKPTVFRRVVDTFLKYLDRVISRFPNTGSSEYLTDVQAFREVLVEVLEKFQADATAEARANGVDAAFSRRRDDQTQTPEFRRWFGDSKVVDADGRPLVVYHGTPDGRFLSEDAVFKSERDRYGFGRKDGAHWFASDARAANTYADARRAFDYQAAEPAVQAAYLKMTNPLVIDAGGAKWRDAQRRGKTGDVIAEAKANGNDGVIIRNVRDDYQTGPVKGDKPTTTYVVFDSAQIKSVENIGTFGQRPVTEAEASRVGMTVDEANEAQGRGSILFSRRRDDQTQNPENPSIRRSRGQGAYIAAQAAARATGAAFRNLNLRLRNSIRDAEEMRRLAADARQLIGVVATAPDYAQELKDLATDITPEKRRILSGDPGPTGDSLRSALAEYDRIRDDMKAVDAARKRVNQQQAEANRMLDRLDRMEADMPMADREQIIAMLDPIVESAQQAYERAKRIRDFRRSKQWALIKAQERRTETMNRLAAEGYAQGAMTWAADDFRWKGVRGFLNTARERFQDRFLALRETQRDIEESVGRVLADAVNVYRMENLMHGRAADRIDQFQKSLIQPLREYMKLNKLQQKDVETYLYARHAKERNARIAQINPNMPDGGSGMSNAEADRILADYQSAGLTPKLEAAARKADAVRRFTLQTLLDSGQITQELHDQLANVYQHYVPLRGKVEDGDDVRPSRGAGKGLDVRGNPVQRAMGRGDENLAENILAEMVGDAERAILQAEKARVGRGLLRLALEFPNPEVWKVEPVEMEYKFSETTGEVYLGIKNDIADPETVVVKHKGKPYRVRLEDPRLRNAVKNLGVENYEGFVKYVGWMNRYLSAMLTRYNPGFVPVNMIRDLIQGTIGVAAEQGFGAAARVLRHWPGALRGLWQDANGTQGGAYQQYAREFAEAGGKTGYMVFQNVEDLQSRIDGDIRGAMALLKQGKPVAAVAAGMRNSTTFQFIEQVNDTIENGMRLSAYIEQRRSGASKEQAAEYAKALTVNFNRKGQLSSWINGLWIFYNAAMQGSYRVAKLLGNRKTQIILGGMMATQTMLAAIGMGMREDEDELSAWDRIPEYVKERSLVIPLSASGAYASIPMPYGFNFLTWMAGYLPNIADRGWRDRNSLGDMVSATGRAMLNAFSPVPIDEGGVGLFPTPTRPFVDIGMNESGLGFRLRNDNPYSAFERPRAYQGRGDTPEVFKMLARGLNGLAGGDEFTPPKTARWLTDRAPEDLEYLFDFVGGGPTRIVSQTMTGVEKLIAGSPTSLGDVPILRALGGKVPGRSQEAPVYYDHRDDLERTAAMIRDRYKQAASEALRASDAAPESVIGAYIGGGHSAARAEAERLGLEDADDVSAGLREISRQAGEVAATQVMSERGMLADGMALKRSKAGDITESIGGTPQLEAVEGTLFDAYKAATKELDAIADQRRAIESDPKIGAIERRRRLDEIAERQSAAMRQVNRTWASVSRTYATGTRQ